MRPCRVLGLAVLSSAILAISAAAQAPGPFVCMTRDFTKHVGYVSKIFQASDVLKVNPAWNQLMTSTYAITALPSQSCQGPYPTLGSADSARTKFITNVQTTFRQPVVQLNWTYNGAPALAYTAQPAPAPAPPPPTPVLTAADRARFQAEIAQSKSYCTVNLKGLYDCDRFAQAVLDHRLAHPEEIIQSRDGWRVPSYNDFVAGVQYKLDCTKCLDDQLLSSWARNKVESEAYAAVNSGHASKANVDAHADCVAKQFVLQMHAKPNVDQYLLNLNAAAIACGKAGQ